MSPTKASRILTPKLLRQMFPLSMHGLCAVIAEVGGVDLVYADGRRRLFNYRNQRDLFQQLTKLEARER